MTATPTRIGIIGCGVISGIYIESSKKLDAIECVAVADVNPAAAQFRATQYDIPKACTPDELLADPDVAIVVNLTPNRLHAQVSNQIVAAGKSAYSEKPLTVYREDAIGLLTAAAVRGVRIGAAPDTFFGGAWQTARQAIDDGLIGQPIAAMACFHGRAAPGFEEGPMRGTPSGTRSTVEGAVSFFQTDSFKYGVTVIFDMGGYYLHNLINLLGPARRVVGATRAVREEAKRYGSTMKVESPTHVGGIVEFANGALCHLLVTSDVLGTGLPHIEIYGTEGSLRCSDPNNFPGSIFLRRGSDRELVELPTRRAYNQDSRGVGVADMAVAIRNGRPHRAAGEMGAHMVDIVNALHESSDRGVRVDLRTTCVQPAPLPTSLENWQIDD